MKEQKLMDKRREEEKVYLEKLRNLPITEQRKLEEKKRAVELKQAKKKMSKMVKFWLSIIIINGNSWFKWVYYSAQNYSGDVNVQSR